MKEAYYEQLEKNKSILMTRNIGQDWFLGVSGLRNYGVWKLAMTSVLIGDYDEIWRGNVKRMKNKGKKKIKKTGARD